MSYQNRRINRAGPSPTQASRHHTIPEESEMAADLSAPPMPRGQMPIEEVFKMMWARMNFLETALKEHQVSTGQQIDQNSEMGAKTISDLQMSSALAQHQTPSWSPSEEEWRERKNTLTEYEQKITTMAQEIGSMKKSISETVNNFNTSMQSVGADLTDMNNKYTQMNNFLMEIQTTQITVNNKILKHYNDTCSDTIETQITKSADEKFLAKDGVATDTDSGDNIDEKTISSTTSEEVVTNAVTLEVKETGAVDVEVAPKSGNNVTFNIE
jgi:seryl-tRNA synthetase